MREPTKKQIIEKEEREVWRAAVASVAGSLGAKHVDVAINWADNIADAFRTRYAEGRKTGYDTDGKRL